MISKLVVLGVLGMTVWAVLGFFRFKGLYAKNPAHEETLKDLLKAGPIIWVILIIISIYNYMTIKW